MYSLFNSRQANDDCPLCGKRARGYRDHRSLEFVVICRSCGAFKINEMFEFSLPEAGDPRRAALYKVRSAFRLASEGVSDFSELPLHVAGELSNLLNATDPTIPEKLERLLLWLAKHTDSPGAFKEFDYQDDFTLFCAHDPLEAAYLLQSLGEQDLVNITSSTNEALEFRLTAKGWSEVTRLERDGGDSDKAFVAMWFDGTQNEVMEAIFRAVVSAGYEPVRIDRIEHVNRIDDEIIAQIRSSRFLIADFTGQRNGVYFEAGFMLGMGRPVIWLCKKAELSNVHFDTRQYNTIDYSDLKELERRLRFRIEAIMGRGPRFPKMSSTV